MRTLLVLLFSLALLACNKPDPNPEKHDSIYLDIVAQQGLVEKELAEYEKQLAEHQANLLKVVPQTGQIRYAQKRVDDAQRLVDRHKQFLKYLTLRSESRRNFVRQKCMIAFQKEESCDFSKEHEDYLVEKRMNQARKVWDARLRREDFLKEEASNKKAVATGSEETPAASGGGGSH